MKKQIFVRNVQRTLLKTNGKIFLQFWIIVQLLSGLKITPLPILPTIELTKFEARGFYLFRIVNPYLIPEPFLKKKGLILALNYHDNLLPKYAGVNNATWATVDEKKEQRITGHKIEVEHNVIDNLV